MFTSPLWFALAAAALAPAPATAPTAAAAPASVTPPETSPATAPETAPEAPSPMASEIAARLATAEKLYKARKYVESARELEALWEDTKQPNALYNAALARFAAGHNAHTVVYLATYLELGEAPAEARELAGFQLDKAKERSIEVPVVVGPPEVLAGGAELVLYPQDAKAAGKEPLRPPLVIRLPPATGRTPVAQKIFLDPGRWIAETRVSGYRSTPQEIEVSKKTSASGLSFLLSLDPSLRKVAFRVDVPIDSGITSVDIEMLPTDPGEQIHRCTIRPFDGNECTMIAEVGAWDVVATAPGVEPFRQRITLNRDEATAAFTLPLLAESGAVVAESDPAIAIDASPDVVPKRTRMRLAGALNGSGLPLFVTGLGLAVYGSNTYDSAINTEAADCSAPDDRFACSQATISAVRMRTAGLALIGTATGLFTTGLTAEFDVKPRVWYAELGVGGVFLVGGAAWLGGATAVLGRQFRGDGVTPPPWEQAVPEIDRMTNHRLAAAMFMGTGIGLVTGSTIGLLVRRRHAQRREAAGVTTSVGPFAPFGGGGLQVQGRF